MGLKYQQWIPRSSGVISNHRHVLDVVCSARKHRYIEKLSYGDHGLFSAISAIKNAIKEQKRIALYADYDVDGTMSCVSWIWFLRSIGYTNFMHYIPDRFSEGYGLNLDAVKYLVEVEKAQIIITMDTGITANKEAEWCKERGVTFICTDHHKIQPQMLPDAIILNPKCHPDPEYQELCGCGITFVLLRQLGKFFKVPSHLWGDLLALAGMATICDVVPLNSVNHRLARLGVNSLTKSKHPVLRALMDHCLGEKKNVDEQDLGFKLGPRINAVGRFDHADKVIQAFIGENNFELLDYMHTCNEKRKSIQKI